ncbi:MAG: MFS transporter, partial [Gemmataceae bacterium]
MSDGAGIDTGSPNPEEATGPDVALPASPRGLRAIFRSLRHANFRLYFCGQLVSLLGTWVQVPALMWLMFELTGQSFWTALIAAAQILPTFLCGAWFSAIAERWPRRNVLMCTQAGMAVLAFLLAAVVYPGTATPELLLAITLVNGFVQAVDLPARLAFVSEMVTERDDVMNAVALNALSFNVARASGPALAGWLQLTVGPATCFLINALSYVGVLCALALMKLDHAGRRHDTGSSFAALVDGFRYLAGHTELTLLIFLAGVLALCGWPFIALLPAFAERTLHVGEFGYSLMLSGTGCGALLAALAVAAFVNFERRKLFITTGVVLLGAALMGLAASRWLPVSVLCTSVIGFGLILFFSTSQGVVQLSAEEHQRGRVMGIWAMVVSGGLPIGNLIVGWAADRWGEPVVLGVQSVICLGAALGLWGLLRRGGWAPGPLSPTKD